MIKPALVVAALALTVSAAPRAAEAGGGPGYPWCAHYSYGLNECNFFTWEQCMVAVRGVGGTCDANLRFRGYPPPPRKYVRRHW
jgi:hypothetical protein